MIQFVGFLITFIQTDYIHNVTENSSESFRKLSVIRTLLWLRNKIKGNWLKKEVPKLID